MYFEQIIGSDIAKWETRRAERRAAENWRFRHLRPRTSKVVAAILSSVVNLFVK